MKKMYIVLSVSLVFFLALTGCGKKSSDNSLLALLGLGGNPGGPVTPLPGSFIKTVIAPNGASSSSTMWGTNAECRYMALYPALDIRGSGMISSISYKYNATAAETTFTNVTIKMGHTAVSTLSNIYADNVEGTGGGKGSFKTVLDSQTVTIPSGTAGNYFTVQLNEPFYYNGVDNLIVEVTRNTVTPPAAGVAVTTHVRNGSDYFTVYGSASGASTAATGTPAYTYPDMRFNFAGGDNMLYYGTTELTFPFCQTPEYMRVQMLCQASEINGAGGITGIGIELHERATSLAEHTVTVLLGHTARSELVMVADDWDANFDSGVPVAVANNVLVKIPAGTWDRIWLPLSAPFNYNGTDNLIVDITVSSSTGLTSLLGSYTGTNNCLLGSASSPLEVGGTSYNLKFRFKDGFAGIMTDGSFSAYPPFHGNGGGWVSGQMQLLYCGVDLGIYGSINSIGFRLKNDSIAESYPNFRIYLGHSDLNALGLVNSYYNNMTDETLVYNHTMTVPAGLKAGDWVDIPLDTAFDYNPASNMGIYILHDAGSGGIENFLQAEEDADLYPARLLGTENQSSEYPGWIRDISYSIRLGME